MDIGVAIIIIPIVLLSIAIHEWAHAKFADLAGDPTPRMMGRVTLNPLAHLDPMGTIMIVITAMYGFGIGWGKPVMVNPNKMRNPRWDHFTSVAAGPISNLIQAIVYAIVLRVIVGGGMAMSVKPEVTSLPVVICFFGVLINVSLFLFNLIPLGPLDGHWLVGAFLPEPTRTKWYQFNRGAGSIIFLAIILLPQMMGVPGPIQLVLRPATEKIMTLLLGG